MAASPKSATEAEEVSTPLSGDSDTQLAEFRPLHPVLRTVWLLSGLLGAAFTAAIPALFETFWRLGGETWFAPPYVLAIAVLVVFGVGLAVFSRWRYDAWRYAIRPHDVLLHHGVFWRVRSCIPRLRIQHVDIQSDPIERAFGIVKLSLYTAGTPTAVGVIPGLAPAEAEELRERLLAREPANG